MAVGEEQDGEPDGRGEPDRKLGEQQGQQQAARQEGGLVARPRANGGPRPAPSPLLQPGSWGEQYAWTVPGTLPRAGRPYPDLMKGSVTVHFAAPPAQVWDLVSDITRIGEFSPETFEARWLTRPQVAATGPEVGARFRGHVRRNGRGPGYWTTCTGVASDPAPPVGLPGPAPAASSAPPAGARSAGLPGRGPGAPGAENSPSPSTARESPSSIPGATSWT